MSILTELKKLTKKKNATVVSQALPDSLDGSGSGSGGSGSGVLVLHESLDETYISDLSTKYVLDKTVEEVRAAIAAGNILVMVEADADEGRLSYYVIPTVHYYDGSYMLVKYGDESGRDSVSVMYNIDQQYPYTYVSKIHM